MCCMPSCAPPSCAQAVLSAVKTTFAALKQRLSSKAVGGVFVLERPIFSVDLLLRVPAVVVNPSVDEIQATINATAKKARWQWAGRGFTGVHAACWLFLPVCWVAATARVLCHRLLLASNISTHTPALTTPPAGAAMHQAPAHVGRLGWRRQCQQQQRGSGGQLLQPHSQGPRRGEGGPAADGQPRGHEAGHGRVPG